MSYFVISLRSGPVTKRKKLTPEEREQRALEAGFEPNSSKISGGWVLRELEPATDHGCQNIWKIGSSECLLLLRRAQAAKRNQEVQLTGSY
jgi:hypothetical protein